ncbi:Mannitol dehydrogenase, partial [Globisporangium splendens]
MSSTAPRTINAYAGFGQGGDVKPWQYQSRPLGAEDVEVKISHCGICGTDVHTLDCGWGPTPFPCVVGHEIVGEVSLVGSAVKDLAVGDRVGVGAQVWACLNKEKARPCVECANNADAYCTRCVWTYSHKYEDGAQTHGGYADYIRVLADYAFKIPDSIPSDAAAPLLCAGATVFTPLKKNNVKPGDRVGVVGIGGLGHIAIQFIRALGATPIAFSRSANKEQEIRNLGAEEFYNLNDPEHAKKAESSVNVLLITADATNMPYNTYLQVVRPEGTVVMLGIPNDSVTFSPFYLVPKGIKFVGSAIGSIPDIKDMLKVASEKNVRPIIQKMPMTKANEGLRMVREGSVRYRVVLEN